MVQRRRTLLKKFQVLAALHFVRRLDMFIKFIVKHQPLLCGKLTDWVIRYETQGRGSLHAHMLWWIDQNPEFVAEGDHVDIPDEVLDRFHLRVVRQVGDSATGSAAQTDQAPTDDQGVGAEIQSTGEKVYDELKLDYTNGNIWALKNPESFDAKLNIGMRDHSSLRYDVCTRNHVTLQ